MKTEDLSSENAIVAGVAELRDRFPRTQDLYREVCVLLFFRHGVTPTANKLYQLVRKGSMSAPTEALNHFWKTLRERSRVTIEHSDLPDELRAAAGELVATLWRSAQSKSHEALAALQIDAVAAVENAKADVARAQAAQADGLCALEQLQAKLSASEEDAAHLREELAAAAATRESLETRLEEAHRQMHTLQARMDQMGADHAAERERLADRTRLTEERFADMEKRALVEIDRERTAAAKLQKRLDAERAEHTAALDRARSEHDAAQMTSGHLREQIGALQSSVEALKYERDRERAEAQAVRTNLDAAVRQAAADNARVDQLRDELERTRREASMRQKPSTRSKRGTKEAKSGDGT
ncbi:DNA-binding protein [Massilia sp. LC238]|uniref:DNA-binding protein n=1 Tax=Massilia sp. LC238 TaxID=1502852 RepID=UPI0004E3E4BA|nr:DNA-binding protein [Massilia sp. LC238]KFC76340.1 chromosome segregation protein SMC [Massilia sp. LC238]